MKSKLIFKQLSLMLVFALVFCAVFTGCSKVKIFESSSLKKEIPEVKYTKLGYGIKSDIDGNNLKVTYAILGFNEDEIKYIYIDQIEKELGKTKSVASNRELGNAYGLAYKSDFGEWYVQLDALQNYIIGNKMGLKEIKEIETYKKDAKNPSLPAKGTDLAVACGLNIGDFLDVIEMAYDNTYKIKANSIGMSEDIKIYNTTSSINIVFSIAAFDYNNIITFSKFENIAVSSGATEVLTLSEKAKTDPSLAEIQKNAEAYADFIIGRHSGEAANVDCYPAADGSALALPKPGTDLAQVCNIDLQQYIAALRDCTNRAQ